ncbi:hypothetical protein TNCV_1743511 [Trichonephila clavipes]|nr:hypothetical protein TNCV_1743511 [Trichonephila clavipes]
MGSMGSPLNPRLHEVSVGPTLCFGSCLKPRMPQSHPVPVGSRFPFEACPPLCFDSCLQPVPRCVSGLDSCLPHRCV